MRVKFKIAAVFSWLLFWFFCILLKKAEAQDSTKCSIIILDKNTSQTLGCELQLWDEDEKMLLKKKRSDGTFDLILKVEILRSTGCELRLTFDDRDYLPLSRTQLRCPINCPSRILARKKPDFDKIRNHL